MFNPKMESRNKKNDKLPLKTLCFFRFLLLLCSSNFFYWWPGKLRKWMAVVFGRIWPWMLVRAWQQCQLLLSVRRPAPLTGRQSFEADTLFSLLSWLLLFGTYTFVFNKLPILSIDFPVNKDLRFLFVLSEWNCTQAFSYYVHSPGKVLQVGFYTIYFLVRIHLCSTNCLS